MIPFNEYAAIYDLIYSDKNYTIEAKFIDDLIKQFFTRNNSPARILDAACGTGRHAIELTKLGYTVSGSDISPQMISISRTNAAQNSLRIPFFESSFQELNNINGSYDIILAMFASLGYLTNANDLALVFSNIANKLESGGLFIFDVWNGSAVIRDYSPYKKKTVSDENMSIIRVSETTLDLVKQIATVIFNFTIHKKGNIKNEFQEYHNVRYFFTKELHHLLAVANFEVLCICPFLKSAKNATSSDWNITVVARKI